MHRGRRTSLLISMMIISPFLVVLERRFSTNSNYSLESNMRIFRVSSLFNWIISISSKNIRISVVCKIILERCPTSHRRWRSPFKSRKSTSVVMIELCVSLCFSEWIFISPINWPVLFNIYLNVISFTGMWRRGTACSILISALNWPTVPWLSFSINTSIGRTCTDNWSRYDGCLPKHWWSVCFSRSKTTELTV